MDKTITVTLTKEETALIHGMMKVVFELQMEGKFPMSPQTLVKLFPFWTLLAEKNDEMNGIKPSLKLSE